MHERRVSEDDVATALQSASAATWQADQESWAVSGGVDLDDQELEVAVVIEADLVVITVF